MATRPSISSPRYSSPDITGPVQEIKRDRVMRMVGALGSMGLLMAGLFTFPYLSFRQNFDPGPAEAPYEYAPAQSNTDPGMNTFQQIAPTDQAPRTPDQGLNTQGQPSSPLQGASTGAQPITNQGTTTAEQPTRNGDPARNTGDRMNNDMRGTDAAQRAPDQAPTAPLPQDAPLVPSEPLAPPSLIQRDPAANPDTRTPDQPPSIDMNQR
jgi:hypothetical protein